MIFAIDPGSVKTGVAVLTEQGELVEKCIIPTEELLSCIQDRYDKGLFRLIVMAAWQYPPEPVDDFVAWIIGLRYIKGKGQK